MQRIFNLYVDDVVRFVEGNVGQVASISINSKGNGGEVVVSYYQLTEKYDEKRVKDVIPDYSLHGTNFSVTPRLTTRQEITQVDYSKYKGRSGTATKTAKPTTST